MTGQNIVARGDSVTFTCSTNGGPNNSYMWLANNSVLLRENANTLLLFKVNASEGGEYTCLVINLAGSSNSSIVLYIEPYITTHPATYLEVELADPAVFYCAADGFPSPEVVWKKVAGYLMDEMNNVVSVTGDLIFVSVTSEDNGTYLCESSAQTLHGMELQKALSDDSVLIGMSFSNK